MQRKYLRAMGRGKNLILSIVLLCMVLLSGTGLALPTSGTVVSGGATVMQTGTSMNINQTTANLIMNWNQFNIGAGEKVNFFQPSVNAISLNRVMGSDPSQIFGDLSANGKVFLINPNGVLFAPSAHVNVGGLLATTMNISDQDFLAGKYTFRQNSTTGSVINQGNINGGNGGYVALFAPEVRNEGVLVAKLGSVALGAGKQVTLDVNGDGLLQLHVDQAVLNANIVNKGLIQVNGGQAILSAKAGDALLATVISNEGIIEAKSAVTRNGIICLEGDKGIVAVSGTLDASGTVAGQKGGIIKVLGEKVGIFDNAKLDASGYAGGGTILIGGNYQGKGREQNSQKTFVGSKANIHADGLVAGDGGKVVVWAEDTTTFQGTIAAGGGMVSGNGGKVEVSGKKVLNYQGNVGLQSPKGTVGTLLLDPKDIVIDSGGSVVMGGQTVAFADNPGNTTTISGSTLASTISSGNVVLQADNDIIFNDNVNVLATTHNSLNLQAGRSMIFNNSATLNTNGGDITAVINDAHATVINRDPGIAKFKMYGGAIINTNGGGVNIATGNGSAGYVEIGGGGGATIHSGSGNITITANGGTLQDVGIAVTTGSLIETIGGGNITLNGKGKFTTATNSSGNNSIGVGISGNVNTVNGDITINGVSQGSNNNNYGIAVDNGGVIQSAGSGKIQLNGTGGNGISAGHGVYIANSGSKILGNDGAISIIGIGQGNGVGNQGIVINDLSTIQSTGTGTVTLTGIGGNVASDNYGVYMNNGATIKTIQGDILVNGTGGNGTSFNPGILVNHNSTIESTGSGKITLLGTSGAGTNDNYGFFLMSGTVRTFDGNVMITGNANGVGFKNMGIRIDSPGALQSAGNGKLTLQGTGSNTGTRENHGILLDTTVITAVNGDISMVGIGGGNNTDSYNTGIVLQNNTFASTGTSRLTLTGTGGRGSSHDYGIDTGDTNVSPNTITSNHSVTTLIGSSTDGVSSDIYSKGGSITGQNLTIQGNDAQGIELGTLNASGNLALTADKMIFNVNMTGTGIIIQPSTFGKIITLGGAGTGLNLTVADLNKLSTGNLQIGSATTGTITVASPLGQGSKNITLQTGNDININGSITNGMLILRGSNGNNTFSIGNGSLDGLTSMRVEGIGGNDSLNINDAASSHTNSYTITGTEVQYVPTGIAPILTITYDHVTNLSCLAGGGNVNQVTSRFIPGITQTLDGGNGAGSILTFDCQGTNPVVTSTAITSPGYGTVTYSGFATVNLQNVVIPTPQPPQPPVPQPPTPQPPEPPTPEPPTPEPPTPQPPTPQPPEPPVPQPPIPQPPNPEKIVDGKYTTAVYVAEKDKREEQAEIQKQQFVRSEDKKTVVVIKNGGMKLPDNVDEHTNDPQTSSENQ